MRCLWVTMADPEPRHNGQYVYSGGLIDSLAAAGGDVEVLGLGRQESQRANGARSRHVVWWLPDDNPHSRWGSLASTLPNTGSSDIAGGMRVILSGLTAGVTLSSASITINGSTFNLQIVQGADGPQIIIPRSVVSSIPAGQSLPRITLRFANPRKMAFSFNTDLYSDPNAL